MIGVIVKDGDTVISKDVYGGEDGESLKVVAKLADESPNLTFQVFKDSDDNWKNSFENATVEAQDTPEKTEWQIQKARGTSAAIDYLAKKLGLE